MSVSNTVPKDIANLYAWWQADSLALNDGDAVSSWADSSGATNNATQSGTQRPTYKVNIVGTKPALLFSGGSSQYLSATGPTGDVFTVFVVGATTDLVNDQQWFQNGNGNGYGISVHNPGTIQRDFVYRLVADHMDGTPVAGQFDIMTASRVTGAGGTGIFYVNGTQQLTTTDNPTTPSATILIGSLDTTLSFLNGYVAEVILYTRVLTGEERAEVHTYLSHKYGITVSDCLGVVTNRRVSAPGMSSSEMAN